MKNLVASHQQDTPERFLDLIDQGFASIRAAAETLLRLYTQDKDVLQKIVEQRPQISLAFLNKMLRVGERSLHPDLLLNGCPAYQRLAQLPYAVQEQALNQKAVDLVIDAESGDVLKVPLVKLTPAQLRQTISKDGLLSRDDQRAWLKRKRVAQAPARADTAAWFVKKDRLIITRACEISKAQILAALAELV